VQYTSHTYTHTHTAYILSHRHNKFKSHCITHCKIHSQTKYQHTTPHNVYNHPNTIQKVDNRNSNQTATTSISWSITMAWHIFSLWMQIASRYWVAVNILNKKVWAGNKQQSSSLAVRWVANTPYHKNVTC